MIIVEGRYYIDGSGRKIGPMRYIENAITYCWLGTNMDGQTVNYTKDGLFYANNAYPDLNLVSEFVEPIKEPTPHDEMTPERWKKGVAKVMGWN